MRVGVSFLVVGVAGVAAVGVAGEPGPSSLPPGMALVPAGEFVMGSDFGEEDERPAHRVELGPFAIDVHAAQWGTLPRAVAAVAAGLVPEARAVDEHTAVVVHDGEVAVHGTGQALAVTPSGDGVLVR